MAGHRDLRAWQLSKELAVLVHGLTSNWPADERFGLTNQARRSAYSIPTNIAEGQGRGGVKEFRYHVLVAQGSLCELQTPIDLAMRLGYATAEQFEEFTHHAEEVGQLVGGLARHLTNRIDTAKS